MSVTEGRFSDIRLRQATGASRASSLVLTGGAVCAAALVYLLTHKGMTVAGLGFLAILVALWILQRRGNGLLVAVAVLLLVPYWYAHVWLVAPVVASLGLFAGLSRTRLRGVDVVFGLLVAVFAASWAFHRSSSVGTKQFVEAMLPFAFYVWTRLMLDRRVLARLQWVLLFAGAGAATTVIYEAIRGVPVFVDPQTYQWNSAATQIFRPGGVFGGSPTAATALAIVALISLSLYRSRPRLVGLLLALIVAAIITTFDRAGIIALILGGACFAFLLPYRRWGRVVFVALALAIPTYAVLLSTGTLGQLSTSKLVNEGIIRSNTLSTRVSLASDALPLVADTPSHFLFGRGFEAFMSTGTIDAHMAEATDLWDSQHGPNDDYLRAILEQGLVGLILLLMWLFGTLAMGWRYCVSLPRGSTERMLAAGLTAALLGYIFAATGHDFAHDVADLSILALLTGLIVSVSTFPREDAHDEGARVN